MNSIRQIDHYLRNNSDRMHYSQIISDNTGITLEYGLSNEIGNGIGSKDLKIIEEMADEHQSLKFFLSLKHPNEGNFTNEEIFKKRNSSKIIDQRCFVNIGTA